MNLLKESFGALSDASETHAEKCPVSLSQTVKIVKTRLPLQPGIHTRHFSPLAFTWYTTAHVITFFYLVKTASWNNYFLFLAIHSFAGVGITLGAHRYFSHKAFKAPQWLENLLAFAYATSFASCGHGLIGWVAQHKFHHAYTDQDFDPHTPEKGFGHAFAGHFIWRREDLWDFQQYKHYCPELAKKPFLVFLEKKSVLIGMQITIAASLCTIGYFQGKAFEYFVWLVCARYVYTQFASSLAATVVHGVWPFHRLKDTFHTKNGSRNNLIYWPVTGGSETWHNVHHAFPSIANNGPYWYHWDLDSFLMWSMAKLKIISGLRLITKNVYQTRKNRHLVRIKNSSEVFNA